MLRRLFSRRRPLRIHEPAVPVAEISMIFAAWQAYDWRAV